MGAIRDLYSACVARRRMAALGDIFVQIGRLAKQAGLVSMKQVAVDGTKIKANASNARGGTRWLLQCAWILEVALKPITFYQKSAFLSVHPILQFRDGQLSPSY